jgi:hypothetical protein
MNDRVWLHCPKCGKAYRSGCANECPPEASIEVREAVAVVEAITKKIEDGLRPYSSEEVAA